MFIFCLSTLAMQAQVTITSATFPKIGDTLRTATADNISGNLTMGNVGGPQTWDFSALNMGQKSSQVFSSPSAGKDAAAFPESNLLVKNGEQELYLKSSANKIEALGFSGNNPFFDAPLLIKYSKRPVFRTAPLTFISTTNSTAEFRIDIGTSIIPDTLLANLPIRPDSIRIQFSSTDKGLLDAFGTLKMQGKTFSVLREKVESVSDTKLFIKLFGLWIDPLPLLGGNIPGGFGNFLGQDTTYVYNFYTDSKKEVLLSAQYAANNDLISVEFADLGGVVSSSEEQLASGQILLMPNPASERVKIEVPGLEEGVYLLTISDMQGRIVKADFVAFNGGNSSYVDIQDVPAGQCILTVRNKANTMVLSRTLSVIR